MYREMMTIEIEPKFLLLFVCGGVFLLQDTRLLEN